MKKQKPKHEIRLGRVKAVIWENETTNGIRYNATFARLYRLAEEDRGKGDTGWRETSSFGRDDLPLIEKVASLAHLWMYSQNQTDQQ